MDLKKLNNYYSIQWLNSLKMLYMYVDSIYTYKKKSHKYSDNHLSGIKTL